jgi:hypothetical protein
MKKYTRIFYHTLLIKYLLAFVLLATIASCEPHRATQDEFPALRGNENNYFYSTLSLAQKKIYDVMLSGLMAQSASFSIPLTTMDEYLLIFDYVLRENPIIFYVSSFKIITRGGSEKATFVPNYKFSSRAIGKYNERIKNVLSIFEQVRDKSDIEKELFVHDFMLKHYRYDHSFHDNSYSVLGLIKSRKAVCQGIALFVKLAMDYLDVHSIVVYGEAENPSRDGAREGHAWNLVRIDGHYYHLDATFNMTITTNRFRYDYFNLCDRDIQKDHYITDKIPAATMSGRDYYTINSMTVNGMAELDRYFLDAIQSGENIIIVKLLNVPFSDTIVSEVTKKAMDQFLAIRKKSVRATNSYNATQMVFEVHLR